MKKNAIIFLVNSLCNGGAERVVVNMANEYAKKDYSVFIICLTSTKTYQLNSKIKVYNLNDKPLSKIQKIFLLPLIVKKVDNIIQEISNQYSIKLITSHLIYSNVISKLSMYRKKIIHVIHVSYKVYFRKCPYLFKLFLKWLYHHVPVVTVSKGCETELLDFYKIKPSYITTIYNPINIHEIKDLSSEKYQKIRPYFLFVGRLDKPKRPDLLVDIFYKGKFYKKYDLCMVGVGPYEGKIREKVKQYHIEKNVILVGWQSNVFPYMKNASLLISTSKNEAFPMTLIEALACDCPVVSFNIEHGPNEILVDDLKKYLVENNNIDSMIKVIHKALRSYPKNLSERVKKFDVADIDEDYLNIVSEWNLIGEKV